MTKADREHRKLLKKAHAGKPKCLHCKVNVQKHAARGLCGKCYAFPEIREKFPVNDKDHAYREPTAEELNDMIRIQSRNLPSWWHTSKAWQRDE